MIRRKKFESKHIIYVRMKKKSVQGTANGLTCELGIGNISLSPCSVQQALQTVSST